MNWPQLEMCANGASTALFVWRNFFTTIVSQHVGYLRSQAPVSPVLHGHRERVNNVMVTRGGAFDKNHFSPFEVCFDTSVSLCKVG